MPSDTSHPFPEDSRGDAWLVVDADNLAPGGWLQDPGRPSWLALSECSRVLIAADQPHKIDAWMDALSAHLRAPCLVVTREVTCAADAADRALLATLKTWLSAGHQAEHLLCLSGDRKLVYQLHAMALRRDFLRMSVCASWAMRHLTDELGVAFWQAPVHARKPTPSEQVSGFAPSTAPVRLRPRANAPQEPSEGPKVSSLRKNPHSPRRVYKRIVQAAKVCGARSKWVSGAQLCERFVREGVLAADTRGKMSRILELAPGVLKKKPGADLWMLA